MYPRLVPAVLAAVVVFSASCGAADGEQSEGSSGAKNGADLVVGVSNSGLNAPFPVSNKKGIQDEAKRLNVKTIQLDAQLSDTKQASNINTLIAQDVDGILLSPNSRGAAVSMIARINAADIPVGVFHGQVGTGPINEMHKGVAFRVSEQEVRAGKTAAQMAKEAVPNGGKVAVITGSPGFTAVQQRMKKFKAIIENAGKYDTVATQSGEWTSTDAYSACQSILNAHPDMALFYTESDDMAVGCAKAIGAKNSDAKIVSVGGQKTALQMIKQGKIYGTVCYKPYTEGEIAMRMMYKLLTGKNNYDGKLVFYDAPAVTKANSSKCQPQW